MLVPLNLSVSSKIRMLAEKPIRIVVFEYWLNWVLKLFEYFYLSLCVCNGAQLIIVYISAAPIAENDADNFRDDIIGQSLMLAHNAVHSSPDQPLASHDPSHQGSHKQPDCTRSHNQRGSHDQHNQLGSHDQQMDWEIGCPESHDAYDGVTKSTASIIPSKITFIDWTEMKRKHVTPSYYSSTPTPINVRLDQDDTISAPHSKKKKKSDTNPTVSIHVNTTKLYKRKWSTKMFYQ